MELFKLIVFIILLLSTQSLAKDNPNPKNLKKGYHRCQDTCH